MSICLHGTDDAGDISSKSAELCYGQPLVVVQQGIYDPCLSPEPSTGPSWQSAQHLAEAGSKGSQATAERLGGLASCVHDGQARYPRAFISAPQQLTKPSQGLLSRLEELSVSSQRLPTNKVVPCGKLNLSAQGCRRLAAMAVQNALRPIKDASSIGPGQQGRLHVLIRERDTLQQPCRYAR